MPLHATRLLDHLEAKPLRLFAAFALLFVVLSAFATWSDVRRGTSRGDLTQFSLAASRVMLHGGDPYDRAQVGSNFKYPPINAVVLLPLAPLPIPAAQGIWAALNFCLLLWAALLHRRMLRGWRIPWWVWAFALGVAWRFWWQNLKLGQWNTSVYCLSFAGLYYATRMPWRGGALIGLAASIKYMPAFFLLLFACRRQWRAAGGVVAGAALALLVVPTLVLGPSRHMELLGGYRDMMGKAYADMTTDSPAVASHSTRSLVYMLLTEAPKEDRHVDPRPINIVDWPPKAADQAAEAAAAVFLLAVLGLTIWLQRRRPGLSGPGLMALHGLWFLALLHISPEVRKAHLLTIFTPLLGAAAWLAADWRARGGGWTATQAFGWAGLAVAALATVLSSRIFRGLEYSQYIAYFGGFTLAIAAATVAVGACLLAEGRGAGPPPQRDSDRQSSTREAGSSTPS